ncbi:MAG: hypothetical protein DRO88_12625 [Promethearchaeia archaeon]|nr:MAG: hypothetical protein DRO88_12625 [Candidatus Lokiarchaeia archaeon]
MEKELVPEIHDILKLTGPSKYHECPNNCPELQTIKNSLIYKALKHHCVWKSQKNNKHKSKHKNCICYPIDSNLFALALADDRASIISRRLQDIYFSRRVFKIWKDDKMSEEDQIKARKEPQPKNILLLDEIASCKDENAFTLFENHKKEFEERSESAGQCPFASLYTHSMLTKYWYNFFIRNTSHFGIPKVIQKSDDALKLKESILKTKKIIFLRLKLNTRTKLARLRDVKLIKDVPKLLMELSNELGSAIYNLGNETLLVCPQTKSEIIENKISSKLTSNYFIELIKEESYLYDNNHDHSGNNHDHSGNIQDSLSDNFPKLFKSFNKTIYPILEEKIKPDSNNEASRNNIICDLCQMASSTKIYEKGQTKEHLCDSCYLFRTEAERATSFASWGEEDIACFINFSIDVAKVISFLVDRFNDIFKDKLSNKDQNLSSSDLGFSILNEFLEDYNRFLSAFRQRILNEEKYKETKNHEKISDNFIIIKLERLSEMIQILNIYKKLITDFFPKFKETKESPIKLAISCSHVKFPFFEHWRYLENPKNDVEVMLVGRRGKMSIKLKQLDALLDLKLENKTAIEKLAKIAETSEQLAWMQIFSSEGIKNHPKLQEALRKGLKLSDLLTYVKIKSD